jgi:hypothetical protein
MNMARTLRTLSLLTVVAVGALLPLFGDPRPSPVTHPEWARMILRALDLLQSSGGFADQASQVFTTLSGRDSLSYRADRYVKAAGIEVLDEPRRVRASGAVGEITYPLAVARGGDYRVRLHLAGSPETPAETEISRFGETKPEKSFTVVPASVPGWVQAGTAHLDPGAYTASVLLPRGAVLEYVEVSPPCVSAIEPLSGWRPTAVTSTEDVAVTVVKALDLEPELPPAAPPIELAGSDFRVEAPARVAIPAALSPLEERELKAGTGWLEAVVVATLPEPGTYTLSVFGTLGAGQSWMADACRRSVLCPSEAAGPSWRPILTGVFGAGRHSFSVTLSPGASVGSLRLERKKASASDYLATLRRLGFEPGPDGPITRDKAMDARGFIEHRRGLRGNESCGDIVRPGVLAAGVALAQPVVPVGPLSPPGGTGPNQLPLVPPALPPQQVASPVLP